MVFEALHLARMLHCFLPMEWIQQLLHQVLWLVVGLVPWEVIFEVQCFALLPRLR